MQPSTQGQGDGDGPARDAEEFVLRVCEPIWRRHRFAPQGRTLVEYGSEDGHLARAFAARFGIVLGFDPRAESVDEARRRHGHVPNLHFTLAREGTLSQVPEGGVDFCFSSCGLSRGTPGHSLPPVLRELSKVLKPGGLVQFRVLEERGGAPSVLARIARWAFPFATGGTDPTACLERTIAGAGLRTVELRRTKRGEMWVLARKPWE